MLIFSLNIEFNISWSGALVEEEHWLEKGIGWRGTLNKYDKPLQWSDFRQQR